MPTRCVGVLLERPDTSLVDRDQMRKGCVEGSTALLPAAPIAACHQQTPVGEIEEAIRFDARFEMSRDRAPAVATHRGRTLVMTANAERHSIGGAAAEFWMEQRVELISVPGSKRNVESAYEIGRLAVFHPSILSFVVKGRRRPCRPTRRSACR